MDFHALFDAQYAPVYRYLAHRLGDPAAAEDLAAETFLRAYAARASFRPGSPRAWLFTIATNLLRDHARGAISVGKGTRVFYDQHMLSRFQIGH